MEVKKTYKLHDAQWKAFNDDARFVVLVAGRRFGKTVLAITKIITLALSRKNRKIWYVAPTYKQAELIAWKMLNDMIPRESVVKKNEVKLSVEIVNGSEISLKGADNEDSLRGVGLHYVVLDEYAMMKPGVWDEIIRPMLTDTKGKALFIGTPAGKNILYQLWKRGNDHEDGWASYHFRTVDNPFIDVEEVDGARAQLPDMVFKQEYEASFEEYAGLCYPMFDDRIHVIAPIEIPEYWKIFRAIDYGYRNPFACLWIAVDTRGIYYVIDEHYEAGQGIKYHADAINKRTWRTDISYIDPSACATTREKNGIPYSIQMDLADENVLCYPASRSDRNVGIAKVGELFKAERIKIFKNCTNTIRELLEYRWKDATKTDENDPEQPVKKNDHACDALRYFCITREKESDVPEVRPEKYIRKVKNLLDGDEKLQEIFEEE